MWGCFLDMSNLIFIRSVFPTHVGVFLCLPKTGWSSLSLPHACGGVSFSVVVHDARRRSSPRMWGCFSLPSSATFSIPVFPTHVGVFPNLQSCSAIKMSLPHTCGGASVDPSKKSPLIYSGRIFLQRTCFLSCFFFHILVHLFVKIEKMNCIFRAHTFLFCMSRQSYNNYMVFVVLYFPTSTQRAFIFRQSY